MLGVGIRILGAWKKRRKNNGGRERRRCGAVVLGCTELVGGGRGGLWLCRIEGGAEASLGLKSEFEET